MTNALKKLLYLSAFLFIGFNAKAQYSAVPDTARLSIGIDGAGASGKFNDSYTYGFGASLQYEVPLNEKFYIDANVGFLSFVPNNSNFASNPIAIQGVDLTKMNLAPLKIGIKYFLIRTFYVQAEAGETLLLNKSDVYAINSNGFTWGPQMGILFKLKQKSYIDAGFRLQYMQSFYGDGKYNNFIGLRAAYAFNLK